MLIGVAAAFVAAGWRALRSDDDGLKLAFDRFWVSHAAQSADEEYDAFVVNGERPGGHFARQTWWTGRWEGFHYHVVPRHDGVLDLYFPASKHGERVKLAARRCDEQGFDYCLDVLGASRGPSRYYSRRGWEWSGEGAPPEAIAGQVGAGR